MNKSKFYILQAARSHYEASNEWTQMCRFTGSSSGQHTSHSHRKVSCIATQYTTLHYTTLHYTTLHYTNLHDTALHCTTLHYTTLHCTTLTYTTLHDTTLHYTILHYTILSLLYITTSERSSLHIKQRRDLGYHVWQREARPLSAM